MATRANLGTGLNGALGLVCAVLARAASDANARDRSLSREARKWLANDGRIILRGVCAILACEQFDVTDVLAIGK